MTNTTIPPHVKATAETLVERKPSRFKLKTHAKLILSTTTLCLIGLSGSYAYSYITGNPTVIEKQITIQTDKVSEQISVILEDLANLGKDERYDTWQDELSNNDNIGGDLDERTVNCVLQYSTLINDSVFDVPANGDEGIKSQCQSEAIRQQIMNEYSVVYSR